MQIDMQSTVPIYIQIAEMVKDMILGDELQEEEQVPSTNEFAEHYKLNPATARKGMNILVTEEIVYKKRGIGMFVQKGAKVKIMEKRKEVFVKEYIVSLLDECKKLGLSVDEVVEMLKENEGRA